MVLEIECRALHTETSVLPQGYTQNPFIIILNKMFILE
jgi:hypothetical protein